MFDTLTPLTQVTCVMKNVFSLSLITLTCSPALAELKLEPTLHLNLTGGVTTADSISELGTHAHDPSDDFALQGLDLGMNIRYADWLEGLINTNTFSVPGGDFESELEEAFLKLPELSLGQTNLEVRAGRFLNRLGLQNNRHLHGWNYVDANLSTANFLGEEALVTDGLELTWMHEFDRGFFALTGSYGKAVAHEEHEEDDHDENEEEHENEEHGHGTAEAAYFNDTFWTTRALLAFNQSDFLQHRFAVNGAGGDNEYNGGSSEVFSADYVFTWSENGLEGGGRSASIGAEFFHRNVTYDAGPGENESHTGFMAFANYQPNDNWRFDLRYDHLSGAAAGLHDDGDGREYEFEVDERDRYSVAVTRMFNHSENSASRLRLQYNHDVLEDTSEDSVWLQYSFDFGPGEIR